MTAMMSYVAMYMIQFQLKDTTKFSSLVSLPTVLSNVLASKQAHAHVSSSDTLTWQVMSKMIYLTSSESADPHHLGQIRGVGRQAPPNAAATPNRTLAKQAKCSIMVLCRSKAASCLLERAMSQWNIGLVTDPN